MPSLEVQILITLLAFYVIYKLVVFLSRNFTSDAARIGKAGEKKVSKLLKKAFRKIPYILYDDILIEVGDEITQIDHVAISAVGIFVVETKNYEGWIFGNEYNRTWTQSLYGNNTKFINPLRQNHKHIKMLEKVFGIDKQFIESIIVFTNYGEFKTEMPDNVIHTSELKDNLRSYTKQIYDIDTIELLADKLEEFTLKNTAKNRRRHRKRVRDIIEESF